jgi:hypothetical protein
MELVREVLDHGLVDRDGFKAGKIDDLRLELRAGERPVVRALVTQHGALARHPGGVIGHLGRWLRARLLGPDAAVGPVAIDWEHVTHIDVVVHLDLDREAAGLQRDEAAIWARWIRHLPWADR